MRRKHIKKSHRVNQEEIEFTGKPITAWGGIASLIAKFLEEISFGLGRESHADEREIQ